MKKKYILMLGPSIENRGGMAQSEKVLLENWKSDLFSIKHIVDHKDGYAFKKILTFLLAIIQFLYFLVVKHPVIIYALMSVSASFYRKSIFILIAKLFNKKVVINSRGGDFNSFYNDSPVIIKRYIKWILKLPDLNIVLGEKQKELFNQISGHSRCKVIHNSIQCPIDPRPFDTKPMVVCTMSHLSQAKGTFDLLEAIPEILIEFPHLEFWLCGDGDFKKIQDIIMSKRLETNVKLLGYVDERKKRKVFLSSSIFVLPSYFEGMPRCLLEAMSYSLPVVTTRVDGIPELVEDGVTGILIEPGDINALAYKIITLLKEDRIRNEMGRNARLSVQTNFNVDAKLAELETEFMKLV